MTTVRPMTTSVTHERSALWALCIGLVLTVAALIVPFVDHATSNVLADHIRAGYPDMSQAAVQTAVTVYLVLLSIVGVLGIACWVWTIWATRRRKRWARIVATVLFVLGTCISLADLLVQDTSGDTGLPALLGWVGMLPCVPGLVAVALLWAGRSTTR
jgi:cytochrome bd-type quinol oxidase subunit 2